VSHTAFGFFGRESELSTINDAAKTAEAERTPQLVTIAGEPGMGKTTLAAWAARELQIQGATVAFGRCDEGLGASFRPWIEAVGHLVEHLPAEVVEAHVAERGDSLARWIPTLSADRGLDGSGSGPQTESSDAASDRFVLLGAVTDLLERAGSDRLVVVILDDVQWADAATLQLLRHVLTIGVAAPVVVVATYRDSDLARGDRLTSFLADTRREANVTRIDLAGFGDVDMLALMETAAGHELTEPGVALAQALRRETKGNPFFTGEMLRHLALSGAIAQSAAGRFELQQSIAEMGLPTSVRDVVARRVDRLGGDAVTVLRAAAVIGLNFDLDLLVELVDLDEDSVLDVLEAATIASLVEDAPEQVGGFTFRHGLVQQTLAQDLSATRRQRIHRRIAEVLQTRVGTNLASPAELAVHFIAATRPVDADQAVHYATAAGDAAMEALASVDAVNWYSQALALHLARPNFDEGLRCDLLTKLGTAQRDSGDPAFRETLLDAAARADRLDDHDRYIAIALAITLRGSPNFGEDPERFAVSVRAAELVDDDDLRHRVPLLATLASETDVAKVDERRELAEQAIELARSSGNDRLLLMALVAIYSADGGPATHERWLADTDWAVSTASAHDDRSMEFWATMGRIRVLGEAGLTDACEAAIAHATKLIGTTGTPDRLQMIQQWNVATMLQRAEVDDAEQLATDSFERASAAGLPSALTRYAAQLFLVRVFQGRSDELVDLFVGAAAQGPGITAMKAAAAYMLCDLGRLDEAREAFPFTRESIENFPDDFTWTTGAQCLASCIAKLGEADLAEVLYDKMLPFKHLFATSFITVSGSLEQGLGQLAATMDRLDLAIDHLRAGVQANEAARAVYWTAQTQLDLADALERRDEAGDADEREPLVAAALESAQTHGFAGLERRSGWLGPVARG
jgi:tetratricopeptide (TPR) repeat protein